MTGSKSGVLGSLLGGALLLASASAFAAGGSVKGTVKLVGKPPAAEPVNMKSDPFCAKQPASKNEEVVVGKGGELKNVVVRISKGVANPPPAPAGPAVIDQAGCLYKPRVVVAQAGQTVEIRNSDMTMHNVHTYKGKPETTVFNLAHVQGTPPHKKKFPAANDVIKFKCDVHPWMTGYVVVVDNPHHAVTGDSGKFELAGVAPGTYTVEAWHEKYGSVTKEVTVADGKPVDLAFEFKAQ